MSRIGRLADAFTEWGSAAADFLFPRLCAGCFDRVADRPGLLCETCEGRIQPLATPVCPVCGQGNAPILPGGSGGACPSCPDPPLFLDAARAFTAYRGVAETVVHKLKYSHVEGHVPFMASRMAEVVRREFGGVAFTVVAAVPLHHARERERGFNQSLLLARAMAKLLDLPVEAGWLRRIRPTRSQTRLQRSERAANIRDAFAVRRPAAFAGAVVLLVDDVFTTGATLNECARVVREVGADTVHGIAFARTPA